MPRFKRPRVSVRLTAAAAVALLAVGGAAAVAVEMGAHADETTVLADTARTGWDQNEPALSPSQVTSANFGQLFAASVGGQVYAQPIIVGSTVIAATENNYVYGLNSVTGAVKWTVNLGPAWPASAIGCGDLSPNVGVTSTPVYDPDTGYVYLTAKVNDGADAQHPHYYMHALNPATGAEETGWPVTIAGAASNDPGYAFSAFTQLQRPGLLLMGGSVYAAFSGHCDLGTYAGFVAGVNTSTQAMSLWTDEPVPSSDEAGIWQSGGGLVSDGPGRIFVTTGNGVSPGTAAGSSPPSELAESVVRLGVAADGTMTAQDFFSPTNASTLDTNDQDLGSGGPVALPGSFGTTTYPHLMVQVGKDGRVFLVNRDDLGGSGQGSGGGDDVLGMTGPVEGVWGHPSVWGGDGGYIYLDGSGGPLRALHYGVTGSGMPALSLAGNSDQYFSFSSGSPVVTSSGSTSGSAVVWVVQVTSGSGANGELLAFNALPVNGKLQLLRSFPIGTGAKFSVPATDSGRVYVGTRDGHVFGFGAPVPAPLTAAPLDFGAVNVGSSANATMTMTAATAVTVTAVTVPAPFTVSPGTLPVSLTAGQNAVAARHLLADGRRCCHRRPDRDDRLDHGDREPERHGRPGRLPREPVHGRLRHGARRPHQNPVGELHQHRDHAGDGVRRHRADRVVHRVGHAGGQRDRQPRRLRRGSRHLHADGRDNRLLYHRRDRTRRHRHRRAHRRRGRRDRPGDHHPDESQLRSGDRGQDRVRRASPSPTQATCRSRSPRQRRPRHPSSCPARSPRGWR